MKDSTFVRKSAILSLSNMFIGILIFIFTIILSREIGPEGMGLYGLIFPVSGLLMSIIAGGLMTAVSRTVANYYAKGEYNNLKKSIKVTLIFNLIVSIVLVFLALLLSYTISLYIIKDLRTLSALRLLFISIIFMTLTNTYKGYFYGLSNVSVPVIIDVFEKVIRILLILIALKLFSYLTLERLITISFAIYCIGEIASLIFYLIFYRYERNRYKNSDEAPEKGTVLLKKVLTISLPLMLTELIGSSFYTISTLLVPRRLVVAGFSYPEALAVIGRFASMSMQIVFFPLMIIGSISTVLIPDITSSLAKKELSTVEDRISAVVTFSFLFGIVIFLLCQIFGDEIGYIIYKRNDLGQYIRFLSYCSPFVCLAASIRGVLNGLGKQKFLLKISIVTSFIEIMLLFYLLAIPSINIYGIGYTILTTSFISIIINSRQMKKVIQFKWFNFFEKKTPILKTS